MVLVNANDAGGPKETHVVAHSTQDSVSNAICLVNTNILNNVADGPLVELWVK